MRHEPDAGAKYFFVLWGRKNCPWHILMQTEYLSINAYLRDDRWVLAGRYFYAKNEGRNMRVWAVAGLTKTWWNAVITEP